MRLPWGGQTGHHHAKPKPPSNFHFNGICIYIYIYNDLLTKLYLFEHKVINQLWRPPHLEHPKTLHTYIYMNVSLMIYWHNYKYKYIYIYIYIWTQRYQSAVETPTLRTSQDIRYNICIYIFWKWSIDITIFIWTQSYQSAVGTPTLRTSQDITTYIYKMIDWHNYIYMNTQWSISWGDYHT